MTQPNTFYIHRDHGNVAEYLSVTTGQFIDILWETDPTTYQPLFSRENFIAKVQSALQGGATSLNGWRILARVHVKPKEGQTDGLIYLVDALYRTIHTASSYADIQRATGLNRKNLSQAAATNACVAKRFFVTFSQPLAEQFLNTSRTGRHGVEHQKVRHRPVEIKVFASEDSPRAVKTFRHNATSSESASRQAYTLLTKRYLIPMSWTVWCAFVSRSRSRSGSRLIVPGQDRIQARLVCCEIAYESY